MSFARTLEKLERFGDSDADRALRPAVPDPDPARPTPPAPSPLGRSWRRRFLVGGAALVVLALVVTWLVGWSPLLGARTVEVSGTTTLTAEQVRTAAHVGHGTPLVRLDTAAVRRRVLQLPEVAAASVTVVYPSTVAVAVTERVPVLYLTHPTRLVDATGRAYRTVDAAPTGLPTTEAGGALVAPAATVAAALPAATRALVAGIEVDPAGIVTLDLADGRSVLWGDTSRSDQKAALLTALLVAPTGGTAPKVSGFEIDLRDPNVVVTR